MEEVYKSIYPSLYEQKRHSVPHYTKKELQNCHKKHRAEKRKYKCESFHEIEQLSAMKYDCDFRKDIENCNSKKNRIRTFLGSESLLENEIINYLPDEHTMSDNSPVVKKKNYKSNNEEEHPSFMDQNPILAHNKKEHLDVQHHKKKDRKKMKKKNRKVDNENSIEDSKRKEKKNKNQFLNTRTLPSQEILNYYPAGNERFENDCILKKKKHKSKNSIDLPSFNDQSFILEDDEKVHLDVEPHKKKKHKKIMENKERSHIMYENSNSLKDEKEVLNSHSFNEKDNDSNYHKVKKCKYNYKENELSNETEQVSCISYNSKIFQDKKKNREEDNEISIEDCKRKGKKNKIQFLNTRTIPAQELSDYYPVGNERFENNCVKKKKHKSKNIVDQPSFDDQNSILKDDEREHLDVEPCKKKKHKRKMENKETSHIVYESTNLINDEKEVFHNHSVDVNHEKCNNKNKSRTKEYADNYKTENLSQENEQGSCISYVSEVFENGKNIKKKNKGDNVSSIEDSKKNKNQFLGTHILPEPEFLDSYPSGHERFKNDCFIQKNKHKSKNSIEKEQPSFDDQTFILADDKKEHFNVEPRKKKHKRKMKHREKSHNVYENIDSVNDYHEKFDSRNQYQNTVVYLDNYNENKLSDETEQVSCTNYDSEIYEDRKNNKKKNRKVDDESSIENSERKTEKNKNLFLGTSNLPEQNFLDCYTSGCEKFKNDCVIKKKEHKPKKNVEQPSFDCQRFIFEDDKKEHLNDEPHKKKKHKRKMKNKERSHIVLENSNLVNDEKEVFFNPSVKDDCAELDNINQHCKAKKFKDKSSQKYEQDDYINLESRKVDVGSSIEHSEKKKEQSLNADNLPELELIESYPVFLNDHVNIDIKNDDADIPQNTKHKKKKSGKYIALSSFSEELLDQSLDRKKQKHKENTIKEKHLSEEHIEKSNCKRSKGINASGEDMTFRSDSLSTVKNLSLNRNLTVGLGDEISDISSQIFFANEEPVEHIVSELHQKEVLKVYSEDEKEVFKNKGIILKTGKWSKAEDEILKQNYNEFCDRFHVFDPALLLGIGRHIGDSNITKFLKSKHFYQRLGKGLGERSLRNIYMRARTIFDPLKEKHKCNATEAAQIKIAHWQFGNKWHKISNTVARSAESCRQSCKWNSRDNINKGPWTEIEEEALRKAIKQAFGEEICSKVQNNLWDDIAQSVGTRNPSQCRLHWEQFLSWKSSSNLKWDKKCSAKLIYVLSKKLMIKEDSEINWVEAQKFFEGVSPSFLRKKWLYLKYRTPKHFINFSDCIQHLTTCYKQISSFNF